VNSSVRQLPLAVAFASLAVAMAMAPMADASSLCRECVKRGISAKYPAMRRCYGSLLARTPKAAGRLHVRFSIERSGKTSGVVVTRNELRDNRFGACIANVFRTIHYPDAPHDTVRVHYPLVFKP
jgi:hypothetical protein